MTVDLLLVAVSLFFYGIGEGSFFYFQPLYLEQLGADPVRIGAVLGGYGLMMAIAQVPAGYLADRFGRRPLLWCGWGLGLVATIIMYLAPNLTVFIIGVLTYGLTYFVMSPMNSYITHARGKWSVSRAILICSGAFNFGMVFGALLGGYVAAQFGLRQIFLASALVMVIAMALILFIRPQPVEHHPGAIHGLSFITGRRYQLYLLAVLAAGFVTSLPQSLSQNFLANQRLIGLETIGWLTALTGLGVAALSVVLSALGERLSFLLAQVAVAGFALLVLAANYLPGGGLPWYALGYFLLGGYKTVRSLAVAQTRDLVPPAHMGLAYGVTEMMGSLASMGAPVLAGVLYASSPASMYTWTLILAPVSIILGAWLSPRRPTSTLQPQWVIQEEVV